MYITVQDMVNAFGQREMDMLADRNLDGIFEAEVVQSHIEQAEGQINFSVSQRCAVPLVAPTAEIIGQLRQWALDITRFRLVGSGGVTATSDVDTRYKEAKEDLDKVMSGKMMLCAPSGLNGGVGGLGAGGLQPNNLTAGEAEPIDATDSCCRQWDMGRVRDFTSFGRFFGNRNSL